jgi:hypothetical protein
MHIPFSIRIIAFISIISIFIYTLWLIRNNRLSAHLAVSWIVVEILLIITVSVTSITTKLIVLLGETNFLSLAFLFIISWIVLLMLDTLIRVSDVIAKTRALVQENGLLREKVENLEKIVLQLKRTIDHDQDSTSDNVIRE